MTFDALKQDLSYALRGLRARPGFTAAVVFTLALGIGANAAMFGIVDRLLFRPPPMLKDPETAHRVYLYRVFRGTERPGSVSQYARFRDIATMTTSFSHEAGHSAREMAVGVGDAAREMQIGVVSSSFFTFFDAPTVVGRYFGSSEDQVPSGEPVTVLSYAMWQTHFGGIESILDSTVQIGSMKYSIIGVAPPGFVGLWTDRPPVAPRQPGPRQDRRPLRPPALPSRSSRPTPSTASSPTSRRACNGASTSRGTTEAAPPAPHAHSKRPRYPACGASTVSR